MKGRAAHFCSVPDTPAPIGYSYHHHGTPSTGKTASMGGKLSRKEQLFSSTRFSAFTSQAMPS